MLAHLNRPALAAAVLAGALALGGCKEKPKPAALPVATPEQADSANDQDQAQKEHSEAMKGF